MNTTRSCGCKSFRSCLLCETELGIQNEEIAEKRCRELDKTLLYSPTSNELHPAEDKCHPGIRFPGIKIIENFVTAEEEAELLRGLDEEVPWDTSQSGRRKQNFGPRANFKRRKCKVGPFRGFPAFTRFVQDRFDTVACLQDYKTVEQCAIEYRPETGACIEPHIDDCWIWGERIVQLNLLSDSALTLFPYRGGEEKYNLGDLRDFPRILDDEGNVAFNPFRGDVTDENSSQDREKCEEDCVVRIPLPRRSLLVMYGQARYDWEHCILRKDISSRRVVIAYRELTPPYLPGGANEEVGAQVLEQAARFWEAAAAE